MQVLHHCANPCNTLIITRKEIRSAVRVRSSALCFSCKSHKNEKTPVQLSGTLAAVGQQ
jgi:hypothetical protein